MPNYIFKFIYVFFFFIKPLILSLIYIFFSFPLYTRGKDKTYFTYGVYLLNKNLAQLRWLFYLNTSDLKSTLPNLLNFLQGQKEFQVESLAQTTVSLNSNFGEAKLSSPTSQSHLAINEKYVSLHSFGSNPNISDPILDCIRHENQIKRSGSPTRKPSKKPISKPCRNNECGRGLSEILAIPEAFLNKQISSDSFRNYMISEKCSSEASEESTCCGKLSYRKQKKNRKKVDTFFFFN